jgi:putative nucleotidyltransferase with HDIG domain
MSYEYVFVNNSMLYFYKKVPLYYFTKNGEYALYKPRGITLKDMRIKEKLLPKKLFIKRESKVEAIQEVQQELNEQLKNCITTNKLDVIRKTVQEIVEITLTEPISGAVEGLRNTVYILAKEYTNNFQIVRSLLDLSMNDYTTVSHSVNVMALAFSYANFMGMPTRLRKTLGLCALLHDIGKSRIRPDLLRAPRTLTEDEFREVQKHTVIGYNILNRCRFHSDDIKLVAMQHHEKLDGSGYPNQISDITELSQIIGIIDCYEALTNNDRVYRRAVNPLSALEVIQSEIVDVGKFSKNIFKNFAYSLLQFYRETE